MMDEVLGVRCKRKSNDESDNLFSSNLQVKSLSTKKMKVVTDFEIEEEARLEKLVFGESSLISRTRGVDQPHENMKNASDPDSGLEEGDDPTFVGEAAMDVISSSEGNVCGAKKALRPAWEDNEDHTSREKETGRESVAWARLRRGTRHDSSSDDEHSSDGDDLLQHCGDLLQSKKRAVKGSSLPSGVLRYRKCNALNRCTHVEGPLVTSVQFHPTSTVAAIAGVSGVASIVEVDGHKNGKLASVQFERFPIHCARFSSDGNEILVGSRSHAHFFSYDLIAGRSSKVVVNRELGVTNAKNFEVSPAGDHVALAGRWGAVHILSARSKEWIATLQMTGEVNSMQFSSDGTTLYTCGEDGQVWMWNMATRSCTHRFTDEGSLGISALAVSACNRLIACGCSSGHVNLYKREEALNKPSIDGVGRPLPICTISNLVTPVTSLKFDPTSEFLLMTSGVKADAVRMLHVPSWTVFTNFPGRAPNIQRPLCADISPHSGYLSIGSSKGTALLYRLSHFGCY